MTRGRSIGILIVVVVTNSYSAPRPLMLLITAGLIAGGMMLIVQAVRAFSLPAARLPLFSAPVQTRPTWAASSVSGTPSCR